MRVWIVVLAGLAACRPRAESREAGPRMTEPHGVAGCNATLRCYKQCRLDARCIAACDARGTLEAQQQSHAVMTCALQSGCDSEPCIDDRCAAPLEVCQGAAVAGALADGLRVDLAYVTPPGWQEAAITGAIKLSAPDARATLYVMPSRPWQGSPVATYHATWADSLATLGATTTMTPAPQRRRLANGYGLLVDGETMPTALGHSVVIVYALVARDRIVPVVGVFDAPNEALEQTLVTWFEGAEIRGGQPTAGTLFDTPELVGRWMIGTDQMRETLELDNGSYEANVYTVRDGRHIVQTARGNWFIEDGLIVFQDAAGVRSRQRIWATQPLRLAPSEQQVSLANPRAGSGRWYAWETAR